MKNKKKYLSSLDGISKKICILKIYLKYYHAQHKKTVN